MEPKEQGGFYASRLAAHRVLKHHEAARGVARVDLVVLHDHPLARRDVGVGRVERERLSDARLGLS
jgi:hypothetical protein